MRFQRHLLLYAYFILLIHAADPSPAHPIPRQGNEINRFTSSANNRGSLFSSTPTESTKDPPDQAESIPLTSSKTRVTLTDKSLAKRSSTSREAGTDVTTSVSEPRTSEALAAIQAPVQSEELPVSPKITPAIIVAGVCLILTGVLHTFIGGKKRRLQIFLSCAFLTTLSITVLLVCVMDPPVSSVIQGAYLVAACASGIILGACSLVFVQVTEGLGCLLAGFCLSMWILTLRPGGTLTSIAQKAILISILTLAAYATSFCQRWRPCALIVASAFAGATALVLGIDCFSKAGLKEFWLYVWDLNDDLFPLGTDTYPITRGMKAESAIIVVMCLLGTLSQLKIWKGIQSRLEAKILARSACERERGQMEEVVGRRPEDDNRNGLARWEATYAEKGHEAYIDGLRRDDNSALQKISENSSEIEEKTSASSMCELERGSHDKDGRTTQTSRTSSLLDQMDAPTEWTRCQPSLLKSPIVASCPNSTRLASEPPVGQAAGLGDQLFRSDNLRTSNQSRRSSRDSVADTVSEGRISADTESAALSTCQTGAIENAMKRSELDAYQPRNMLHKIAAVDQTTAEAAFPELEEKFAGVATNFKNECAIPSFTKPAYGARQQDERVEILHPAAPELICSTERRTTVEISQVSGEKLGQEHSSRPQETSRRGLLEGPARKATHRDSIAEYPIMDKPERSLGIALPRNYTGSDGEALRMNHTDFEPTTMTTLPRTSPGPRPLPRHIHSTFSSAPSTMEVKLGDACHASRSLPNRAQQIEARKSAAAQLERSLPTPPLSPTSWDSGAIHHPHLLRRSTVLTFPIDENFETDFPPAELPKRPVPPAGRYGQMLLARHGRSSRHRSSQPQLPTRASSDRLHVSARRKSRLHHSRPDESGHELSQCRSAQADLGAYHSSQHANFAPSCLNLGHNNHCDGSNSDDDDETPLSVRRAMLQQQQQQPPAPNPRSLRSSLLADGTLSRPITDLPHHAWRRSSTVNMSSPSLGHEQMEDQSRSAIQPACSHQVLPVNIPPQTDRSNEIRNVRRSQMFHEKQQPPDGGSRATMKQHPGAARNLLEDDAFACAMGARDGQSLHRNAMRRMQAQVILE